MSYHVSNLGKYSGMLYKYQDKYGYIPTENTNETDLSYDHGTENLYDENDNLTEYGSWWKYIGFPDLKEKAIEQTELASKAIELWIEG